jgi:hypothetical protein
MPLDGVRNALRELAKVPALASKDGAAAIEKLWRRSYRAGQDPYGNQWAPNAPSTIARKGHGRVMQETGATLRETRATALPSAGIKLTTGHKAAWHMQATENRPARKVMPAHGLPATWRAALKKIVEKRLKVAAKARR